jgi:hypothetical protein
VPPNYLAPIVFEGQLIRFLKEYGYVDAANGGLALAMSNPANIRLNPTRSVWISRFYDVDVISEKVRPIEDHAGDLRKLVCETIPAELKKIAGVDLGPGNRDYRVIVIAHSMGGLVSRCLIQNVLPDPGRWIHRLVTIGTPHGGIELSAVPDILEDLVAGKGNLLGAAIFKETRMREYLKLSEDADLKSLDGKFPEGRCLCIVGSDHDNYNVAKKFTGSHSDGLVKQSNAYIKGAYWANVHRAHSGRRGIVNSFETYETWPLPVRRHARADLAGEHRAAPRPAGKEDDRALRLRVRALGARHRHLPAPAAPGTVRERDAARARGPRQDADAAPAHRVPRREPALADERASRTSCSRSGSPPGEDGFLFLRSTERSSAGLEMRHQLAAGAA